MQKYRADVLPLEAVGQEGSEGVKEPNLEVYRDQNYSLVKFSQNEDGHSNSKESRAGSSRGSERRATELGREGETKPTQPREERSPRKLQGHSNQSSSQHDHGVQATSVPMVPHVQDSQRVRDDKVRRMKDQVIRAKAYLSFATSAGNSHLVRELRLRIKEVERALSRARKDSDLSRRASQKTRSMERTLSKANRAYSDCNEMVNSLRSMANNAENQAQLQRNQATRLTELVGRTTPKGLHCLSMRLTADYFTLEPEQQVFPNQQNIYNPDLLHYAVFSDNVLAAAVVVNSTVSNTKEPGKSVFHVVTDSLNFPAFSMWFLLNPPREATIHVLSVKDFVWLSTTYDVSLGKQRSIDPRHSSLLNHQRFDLPKMFPQLNKILFLDHDVVVQKDLSGLFKINMKGKVNGAVKTCHKDESSYRQMDMLINFSDPWVATKLDANACTWAFGMNLFDLSQWRHKDLTASYRRLLLMGNGKPLWTAGSLPLGWIPHSIMRHFFRQGWHLLGLGYDSQLRAEEIKQAALYITMES
ncbi:hypothetical protein Cgig2_021535 [Carnegiea gigantea]|uniref:Hexosyltransferase n=1 Tax=Carnegiea gigantea TaxID=171969 RepID=A0A9Q1KE55_9CARY|nr:hypothetical protein Cgig2_021535 [Carnegiea gigantea]